MRPVQGFPWENIEFFRGQNVVKGLQWESCALHGSNSIFFKSYEEDVGSAMLQ
jgi:hypothetical protein